MLTVVHVRSPTQTRSLSHPHTRSLTRARPPTITHARPPALTLAPPLSRALTRAPPLFHSHARSHSRPPSPASASCWSFSLSRSISSCCCSLGDSPRSCAAATSACFARSVLRVRAARPCRPPLCSPGSREAPCIESGVARALLGSAPTPSEGLDDPPRRIKICGGRRMRKAQRAARAGSPMTTNHC